ncbi:GTP-binding protein [Dyella sp.]|uniref:GTP-binding protein n=1 Tax=Dyella sp. TaxID=1869338 RepID=UPI0039C8BD85
MTADSALKRPARKQASCGGEVCALRVRTTRSGRINEVVFIGRDVDRESIERAFMACHLNFTEMRNGSRHWRQLPDPFPAWQFSGTVDGATV